MAGGKNALTASGQKLDRTEGERLRTLGQSWQARAFAYYDLLGEIKYAAQFYSRMLSPLRLFVGEVDDHGEIVESQNARVMEYLERIQDPGGGRTGLLSSYGRLMFLAGECYLFVSRDRDTGDEQWEMLSTDEVRYQGSQLTRVKAPSLLSEEYHEPPNDAYEPVEDDQAVAYRLWRRHPRFSMLADSTMQGVLDLAEELLLLTQTVRGRARSRLAGNGILVISESLSPAPPEAGVDEDPLADPLIEELTEAMTTPIAKEGTASSVVPLVIRGSTEAVKDGIRHIQLVDPTQLYPETGLRRECIERIAIGLDMPPEILLGLATANHWSGWMIDEQTWRGHGMPLAQGLCDDLTSAYLRPALRKEGVEDYARYVIAYDAAAIVTHPDRAKDAKDLHDRGCLSDEALREAAGFDDSDTPSADELMRWIGVRVRDGSLAVYGIPSLRTGGIEPEAGVVQTPDATSGSPIPEGTGADVAKKPPDEPLPGSSVGSLNGNSPLMHAVIGAAGLAVYRAREVAGNRLRSLAKRDQEALRLLEGVRVGETAAVLGTDRVRALGAPTERDLVGGPRDLLYDHLPRLGVNEVAVCDLVADAVEQHAARTLYDRHPPGLPASFEHRVAALLAGKR